MEGAACWPLVGGPSNASSQSFLAPHTYGYEPEAMENRGSCAGTRQADFPPHLSQVIAFTSPPGILEVRPQH